MPKPIIHFIPDPSQQDHLVDTRNRVWMTHLRDSDAESFDAQGNLFMARSNRIRHYKAGVDGRTSGSNFYYSLEQEVFNNILAEGLSENFASWSIITSSLYAKTQLGPTADYDADELAMTADAGSAVAKDTGVLAASKTITFSVWMKSVSGTVSIRILIYNSGGVQVATQTCNVTTSWQRFAVTQVFSGASGNIFVEIRNGVDATAKTIYLYGAQVEETRIPSSYVRNTPKWPARQNLIHDGDMELDFTGGWTVVSSTITKDRTEAKFNRQSMKCVTDASTEKGFYQNLSAGNGSAYKVTLWVKSPSSALIQLRIYSGWNITGDLLALVQSHPIGEWQKLETVFVATSTQPCLFIVGVNASVTFYVDKVEMYLQFVDNPGFEQAFVGGVPPSWSVAGGATSSEETVIVRGLKATRLVTTTGSQGISQVQSALALSINTWYQMTAWVYIVSRSAAGVVPHISSDSNIGILAQKAKDVVGSWQKVEVIFKTTGTLNASDAIFIVQSVSGNSTWVVDDVSIIELLAPASTHTKDELSIPLANGQPHNLLLWSEDFSNAVWTKSAFTIQTDYHSGPNGEVSADALVASSPAASAHQDRAVNVLAGETYVFSVWLKSSAEGRRVRLVINDTGGQQSTIYVSPTGQWARYFIAHTFASPASTIRSYIESETGDTSFYIFAWGAQLEKNSSPSLYQKTLGTAKPKIFTNYASSNFTKERGSVSFRMISFGAQDAVSAVKFFGDDSDDSLLVWKPSSVSTWEYRIRGRNKAGVSTLKQATIANSSAMSAGVEHHVVMSWDTERDKNGKAIQSRVKVFVNGVLQNDDVYTDIQTWRYNSSNFKIIPTASVRIFVRDIRVYSEPLPIDEVVSIFTSN